MNYQSHGSLSEQLVALFKSTQVQTRIRELIEEKEDAIGPYSIASLSRPDTPRPHIDEVSTRFHSTIVPFVDNLLERQCTTPVLVRDACAEDCFHPDIAAIYQKKTHSTAVNPHNTILLGSNFKHLSSEEVLSHEYTHHHQQECGFFAELHNQDQKEDLASRVMREGHALGVEFMALKGLIRPGLPLVEAQQLYYLSPIPEFVANRTVNDERAVEEMLYSLGYTLFAIAEAKHGPGIYAEALRNPRAVLG